jgi:hypothetical protein
MDLSETIEGARGLTAGVTNLDTSLTNMHGDDFTHFLKVLTLEKKQKD